MKRANTMTPSASKFWSSFARNIAKLPKHREVAFRLGVGAREEETPLSQGLGDFELAWSLSDVKFTSEEKKILGALMMKSLYRVGLGELAWPDENNFFIDKFDEELTIDFEVEGGRVDSYTESIPFGMDYEEEIHESLESLLGKPKRGFIDLKFLPEGEDHNRIIWEVRMAFDLNRIKIPVPEALLKAFKDGYSHA